MIENDTLKYIKKIDLLIIAENASKDDILEKFFNNPGQIIYICQQSILKGILTLGNFLENYNKEKIYINEKYIKLQEDISNMEEAKSIFKNNNIRNIPIVNKYGELTGEIRLLVSENNGYIEEEKKQAIKEYYFLLGKRAVFIEQLKNKSTVADLFIVQNEYQKRILKNFTNVLVIVASTLWEVELYQILKELKEKNIPSLYFARPDIINNFRYSNEAYFRMNKKLSFPKMAENYSKYKKEFQCIYGEYANEQYINLLKQIPPVISMGERTFHVDKNSELINVNAGKRKTVGQPQYTNNIIHFFGRCGVFGYAVSDEKTIPSFVQKKINQFYKNIKVENHGVWGAETESILKNVRNEIQYLTKEDRVVFYLQPLTEEIQNVLNKFNLNYFDCTEKFHQSPAAVNTFFDKPGHMSSKGYEVIAGYIYDILENNRLLESVSLKTKKEIKVLKEDKYPNMLEDYLNLIKQQAPMNYKKILIGAIVMNCNPFTYGHQYLIQYASSKVNHLFIFVVEENKSFFSFEERLNLVKAGTKNMKNVCVVGSGKFMISTKTFPDYFLKEQKQNAIINPSEDIMLFAQYIAPALNIKIRFAGMEPKDIVTRQYNEAMKSELPNYGIEFCEIPRKEMDGNVISASSVREYLETSNFKQIRKIVPKDTYEFLLKKYSK